MPHHCPTLHQNISKIIPILQVRKPRLRENWPRHTLPISSRVGIWTHLSPQSMPLLIHHIFSWSFSFPPRQLFSLFTKQWSHSFIDPFNYQAFMEYLVQKIKVLSLLPKEKALPLNLLFSFTSTPQSFLVPTSMYLHSPLWSSESILFTVAQFSFQNGRKVDGHIVKGF